MRKELKIFIPSDSVSRMKRLYSRLAIPIVQAVCLVFLLLAAQGGALLHEFSHLDAARQTAPGAELSASNASTCALCPSFAQAASPTFAHSFVLPSLAPAGMELVAAPQIKSANASLPTARSRGPPNLS
jgi:hypothetical protein